MKIQKNEVEKAMSILKRLSFVNLCDSALFFDIDFKKDEQDSSGLIMLTESSSKNAGYAGITHLGLLKFSNEDQTLSGMTISAPTAPSIGYVNLDYAPTADLSGLFELELMRGKLDKDEIEFIKSKDCYLIKSDNILALFK